MTVYHWAFPAGAIVRTFSTESRARSVSLDWLRKQNAKRSPVLWLNTPGIIVAEELDDFFNRLKSGIFYEYISRHLGERNVE